MSYEQCQLANCLMFLYIKQYNLTKQWFYKQNNTNIFHCIQIDAMASLRQGKGFLSYFDRPIQTERISIVQYSPYILLVFNFLRRNQT